MRLEEKNYRARPGTDRMIEINLGRHVQWLEASRGHREQHSR